VTGVRVPEDSTGLEPKKWDWGYWGYIFGTTSSRAGSRGGPAAGTRSTKSEGFRRANVNVSVPSAATQLKAGHSRGQRSDACVFLEFRGLSCVAFAPAKSGPSGARGHTGTDGALVEGLVALGLLEFDHER